MNVTDELYTLNYRAETIVCNDVHYISFDLGFRIEPRVDFCFRQVVKELIDSGEVDVSCRKELHYQPKGIGDFKFVVGDSFQSYGNDLPFWKRRVMKAYFNLKELSVKEQVDFGLEQSNVVVEKYALVVEPGRPQTLKRIYER